ncbi:hypothetical protein PROFUN_16633 [Planoprotostelium fungivorum]|uniref:Uncharacterized protein n=1 Tax=Planoprotostelium fungivorum TaxID=1890364 RepID=A0A2P6MP51_9EUKA|nr:hypothetical protein PROFUN_16633 [Planoprotostelium fungivorum]
MSPWVKRSQTEKKTKEDPLQQTDALSEDGNDAQVPGAVAKRQALPTTMGSICDHKCIVYGSSDSSAERYCLSTPSIRAKSLLLFSFFVKRPKCDLENVAYNSCLLATTLQVPVGNKKRAQTDKQQPSKKSKR